MTLRTVLLLSAAASGLSIGRHDGVEGWKSRSIYQVLTDRFALSPGASDTCGSDLRAYCGGTFRGIEKKLGYIKGMGFDAVWISPVVSQVDGGYHGYWARDLSSINENFGSFEDLKSLVDSAHDQGIWIMLDVVVNHMGAYIDQLPSFVPFNDSKYFHSCATCPENCMIQDFYNDEQTYICRLASLPDLNQSRPDVAKTLISVYSDLFEKAGIDGVRMDTVTEVEPEYWKQFKEGAAPETFIIGEVFNGDPQYLIHHGSELDSLLNYPLFFTIRDVFQSQKDMRTISQRLEEMSAAFGNKTAILGTFVDNHDNARFLNTQPDVQLFHSALVFSLTTEGIPIVYYGSEQLYNGGNDPYCREKLWTSNYENSTTYNLISTVNRIRNEYAIWNYSPVELASDNSFYAFSRGKALIAVTNAGSQSGSLSRTITKHPYNIGSKLCNAFYPSDCIMVTNQGVQVDLINGESKIFTPV
ncbi:hypothetical protein AAMO2058_000225800 [Amorphochlora amoebiformis]